MSIFRKYKTAEELLPGFLLEKEIGILHKSYMTYSGQLPVFTDWLKENGHGSLPIKKITPETISDFFYYLGRDKGLDLANSLAYHTGSFMYLSNINKRNILISKYIDILYRYQVIGDVPATEYYNALTVQDIQDIIDDAYRELEKYNT